MLRFCWCCRYKFMSIFIRSDDPLVGETRHNRHQDLLYSVRLPANCLHPQSHRTSLGARSDAPGLSPGRRALLASIGVLQGGGVEFLTSPPAEHPHDHRHHAADDPTGAGTHRRDPSLLAGLLRSPALQRPDPALDLLGSHLRCSRSGPLARRVSIRRSRSVMLPSMNVTRGWSRRCSMFTRRPVARLSMMVMLWCCARYDVSLETEQERRQE